MLALLLFRGGGSSGGPPPPPPPPNLFPFAGGGYTLLKDRKKKKKLPPVVELEHVLVVPQHSPNYDVAYRYLAEPPEVVEIRVKMMAYVEALKLAREENAKIERSQSDAFLILLAIMDE